ncbi:MAG: tRNA pseudouridine(38-40) synthase TruA [Campylobacterales bacterium]|nr:tRNA pseudouridine(38-40) synthase TruA [Campylobacterales bacterium]
MKVKATIAYDGSKFFGFQRQVENGENREVTVESKIEEVLQSLEINEKILGSGRTDRGVHAIGQVISFDVPEFWKDLEKLKKQLNLKLSPTITIKSLIEIGDIFHPRYNAKTRSYRYIVANTDPNPFLADYVMFKKNVNLPRANEAMKCFIGKHDFEYFRKTGSDENSTTREIYKAFAYKHRDLTIFVFEGDGFLRSQIRLMMAGVIEYLNRKVTLENIQDQLKKKEKKITKPITHTGLYLAKIKY